MDEERREALRARYLSLGAGELAAAVVFLLIAAHPATRSLGPAVGILLWCGLGPLLFVLVQGGLYWISARSWVGRGSMPPALSTVYRALRFLNPLLLAVGLGVILARWPDDALVGLVMLVIWAFGVGEYLNYYVVRLAYPIPDWFRLVWSRRTPRLVKDMRAAS